MHSLSSISKHAAPQQDRSSRRRVALLDAAAEIMAEVGYEAATMSAIASRSKTSIGGLYRYFPDKAAVEHALLCRYEQWAEDRWLPLIREAEELSACDLAARLILQMGEFAVEHPSYLRFVGASGKFAQEVAPRRKLRTQFSKAIRAKKKSMTPQDSLLVANVVRQILRGMVTLYAEGVSKDRPEINAEFLSVLANYLCDVLD